MLLVDLANTKVRVLGWSAVMGVAPMIASAIANSGLTAALGVMAKLGDLKIWDLLTGKEVASFSGEAAFCGCAFAPDGVTVVAGDSSGAFPAFGGNGRFGRCLRQICDRHFAVGTRHCRLLSCGVAFGDLGDRAIG